MTTKNNKPQAQETEAVAEDEIPVLSYTAEDGALVIGEGTQPGPAPDAPRPWRVEVFGAEGAWGYRVVAANGTTVKETTNGFETVEATSAAIEADELTAQTSRVDKP